VLAAVEESVDNIEISPAEVRERLDKGEQFIFVDVREPWERDTAHIGGSVLIPLRDIPGHLGEFEDADEVILYCHHGMRSLDAAAWLRAQGVAGARSMAGGIDRWSVEVDSSIPRY
jgi:rhodanese-related sulfurtransferase